MLFRVGGAGVGAAIALAACGWIAVHGLSSARVVAGLPATTLPWDADALHAEAPDGRVLALRPTDDRARLRDLFARAGEEDGAAFRVAARGVERWARVNPNGLFAAATVALHRFRERGDPEDRAVAEGLLRTYVRRAPALQAEAGRLLRRHLGDDVDPRGVTDGLPPALAAWIGHAFADRPDVAWPLAVAAVRDPAPLEEGHGLLLVSLSDGRPAAEAAEALDALARRDDVSPALRETARARAAARRGEGPR